MIYVTTGTSSGSSLGTKYCQLSILSTSAYMVMKDFDPFCYFHCKIKFACDYKLQDIPTSLPPPKKKKNVPV